MVPSPVNLDEGVLSLRSPSLEGPTAPPPMYVDRGDLRKNYITPRYLSQRKESLIL